jgi:NADH dehydrogenase FAD-containing subunit
MITLGEFKGCRQPMKRIIIVGGGYAGTMLARALDRVAEVVLIEAREAFVHNVASIRAMVDPSLIDRIVLPYDRLLARGSVIRGRVTAVADGGVSLGDGRQIDGDIIVLATGSSYASPFKPCAEDMASFRTSMRAAHDALRAARRVAIVGAGAVGTELSGEIAAGMPGKVVTLISATPRLFPGFPAKLGTRLARELGALGVDLRLGVTAVGFDTDPPASGALRLSTGTHVEADLIVPAIGARATSDLARSIDHASLDRSGRVIVDRWLRVAGRSNLFAVGDVAACGDLMTIVAVSRQAPWLAKAIKAGLTGRAIESLAPYTPWPAPPILVPLGAMVGATVLPLTRHGPVVGSMLTAAINGRELFIPRYRKEFGYA